MGLFVFVYILCVIDYALTAFGIINGWIVEANPLLKIMDKYPAETGILMALIVGMILVWVYRQKKAWVVYPMIVIAVTKVGIILIHSNWIYKIISRGWNMEIATIKSLFEYGVFVALFIVLFVYEIKMTEKRELKYQETIKQLGDTISITVCDSNRVAKQVDATCNTIFTNLRGIDTELKAVKDHVLDVKGTVDDIQMSLAKGK